MDENEDVDDEPEQPPIEDEEMADFSEVAEMVEAGAGEGADGEDGDEDVQEDGADPSDQADGPASLEDVDERDLSVGTIYCNGLGMSAAIARTRYGTADEDNRDELLEEYSGLAEDLQIDEYVDQWMEEHGGMDQLSPGQAILLSTMLWGSMVVMEDPEILENARPEVGN